MKCYQDPEKSFTAGVDCHLHGHEGVQPQVVLTTAEDQMFHLLSVCCLITILDEIQDGGIVQLSRVVCPCAGHPGHDAPKASPAVSCQSES